MVESRYEYSLKEYNLEETQPAMQYIVDENYQKYSSRMFQKMDELK